MYGKNQANVVELKELAPFRGTYRGVELKKFYCIGFPGP